MLGREKMSLEFGRAYFDKEFGAAITSFSSGLCDPISPSPLQLLSKTNYPVWAMNM